jgi:hypothetical protein
VKDHDINLEYMLLIGSMQYWSEYTWRSMDIIGGCSGVQLSPYTDDSIEYTARQ